MVPPQTGCLAGPQPPAPLPPLLALSSLIGHVWDPVPWESPLNFCVCGGVGGYRPTYVFLKEEYI